MAFGRRECYCIAVGNICDILIVGLNMYGRRYFLTFVVFSPSSCIITTIAVVELP